MDLKSLRDREFNKRVRDVVSRDRSRLRDTFDKYDKECAERMAEIHHMQEKVRFSMRSLAMDKIQIHQANGVPTHHRRSSESRVPSLSKNTNKAAGNDQVTNKRDDDGEEGKQTRRDENTKRHRASVTSISCKSRALDIPGPSMTNRRASSPFALPVSPSGSPRPTRQDKSSSFTGTQSSGSRSARSSSYPTDGLSKTPPNGRSVLFSSQPRSADTHNMLSVNDMRMTTKSPVVNLRRKSTDSNSEARGNRKVSERKSGNDCSPNSLRIETLPVRQRSTSVSHLPSPQVTGQKNQRKLSGTGQKVQLFRTRSNSLPDLLSPDSILTTTKQNGSSQEIKEKKNKDVKSSKPIQISRSQTKLNEVDAQDNSPLARSFEEIRHCRYLRCNDTDL